MRAWRQWVLLIVSTAGLAATLCLLQGIVSRYAWRLDLTPGRQLTLSEHSRHVLASVQPPVQITAFVRTGDTRNADIEDLLARFERASARVQTTLVDVNRNPAVAQQNAADSYAGAAVESGGRRVYLSNPTEALLIAAILRVTRAAQRVVYFVTDHGEANLDSGDRRTGYSGARVALTAEFYDVQPLRLIGTEPVPADADAVVLAAPRHDLLPEELVKLDAYLARGGSVLMLLAPHGAPSADAFVARYGVVAGSGAVLDSERRLFAGDALTFVIPDLSDRHPVTAALTSPPLFSRARTVGLAAVRPAGIRGIEILHSSASSWQTPEADVSPSGAAVFVAGRDRPGPLPLGVSLVLRAPDATPGRYARLLVLGDADFADNFFLDSLGNKDLLVNAVNWLVGDEALVGERPQQRTPGVNQFFLSAAQGRRLFVAGTIVQPAVVVLLGVMIAAYRRWQ